MAKIHLRILGYITTLLLHVLNMTVVTRLHKGDVKLTADERVKVFRGMSNRYFTCWTVFLQIIYAFVGLSCDLLTLKNSKNNGYQLPKQLKGLRNIMFSALVWPCSLVVFTVFWSLFLYDRSLIFPEFIDKIISPTTNHILHTAIVPIAIWEVVYRPRAQPRSHLRNLAQLAIHVVAYLAVLYYTYYQDGIWLYPIFAVTYGSIHFALLHVYLGIMFIAFYFLQWWLTSIIHGSQDVVDYVKMK